LNLFKLINPVQGVLHVTINGQVRMQLTTVPQAIGMSETTLKIRTLNVPKISKDKTMCLLRNNEARSREHFWRAKATIVTYSECVFIALAIQHAKRMRFIILSSVASLAPPHFSALSHKRKDGRKKLLNVKRVLISCTVLSEIILNLREIQRDIVINVKASSHKVLFILARF
jgi:hypothetical protein